jgi:subtilisin family serine protease
LTYPHTRAWKPFCFLLALLGACLFAPATWAQPAPNVKILVKTSRGLTEAQGQAALRGHGAAVKKSIPKLDLHVIEVPAQAADAMTKALKADTKNIARVETERTRKAQGVPSDTLYPTQWALPKIGWDQVYGIARPGTWTRVAILDTGIEGSHPDFAGVLAPGTSIIDGSDGLTDTNGHGAYEQRIGHCGRRLRLRSGDDGEGTRRER